MLYVDKNKFIIEYIFNNKFDKISFFIHCINKFVLIDNSIIDNLSDIIIIIYNKELYKIKEIYTEKATYFIKNGNIHNLYDTAIINNKHSNEKYFFINGLYYYENEKMWLKDAIKLRRKEKLKNIINV